MRIAHYAPRIGAAGGISTYIRRLGEAQLKRGYDVRYCCLEHPGTGAFPADRVEVVADDEGVFDRAQQLDVNVLHLHRSVSQLPEERVPTVRTMHGHQGGCPSGSRYLARPGKPCDRAYTMAGCLYGHFVDRCGSVRPQQLISNFRRIHHERSLVQQIPTYTVSQFLKEQMIRAGCPEEKLTTIPSPAPAVAHEWTPVPDDGVPRFLYLGRLVPQKGLEWLLRAFSKVEAPARLDVAGEGPQENAMRQLARELDIEGRVTFHGWVDGKKVEQLMHDARAVVFPSMWHEPAGLVSLEAAAYGRPVIASRSGGIPEYALPSFATLVEPGDMQALAAAIETLATDRSLANRCGKQGRREAKERFSMHQFVDRVENWYRSALT